MTKTVTVEIKVDEAAADALKDADRRARIGRLVSQVARLYKAPIRSLPSLHGPLSQPRERG